jgi:invasion protein IalB
MARSLLTLLVMLLLAAAGQAQRTPTNTPAKAWVKLCEKNQVKGKDKEGRELTKDVDACVTQIEQIRPESGKVIVSAKYHQIKIDGQEKQSLQLTVPLGVVLPAGVAVTVFPKDLWDRLLKNQKLKKAEEEKLKTATVPLTYAFCSEFGCNAEVEANTDLLGKLKGGAGFVVQYADAQLGRVAQPISLSGFSQALVGPAVDTRGHARSRSEFVGKVQERSMPLYSRPIRCDMVVDDRGPCSARFLLKR